MLDFLVRIHVSLPPDMDPQARSALLAAELTRGRELLAAGTIRDIWRVPGGQRNAGIWCAPDPSALHEAIASLPCYPWLDAEVTALGTHPVRAA